MVRTNKASTHHKKNMSNDDDVDFDDDDDGDFDDDVADGDANEGVRQM